MLKRGILQQLATPRELYENPGNLFVAGFIGSPPMNFVPAEVDGTSVKLPFGTVQIPEDKASKAQGKGLLIAGIRPEHFEDASVMETGKEGSTFTARVDATEWLGNEAYAYIPFEAPPEVQGPAHAAGEGPRRRVDAHAAGDLAGWCQPDRRGRRGGDLGRLPQDPPLRSRHGREPHGRPRQCRPGPRTRGSGEGQRLTHDDSCPARISGRGSCVVRTPSLLRSGAA
ncbi:hypothetical protein [Nocardioides sp. B-3]|uniref:hypothetical protein n=1 Tax=Nocardioides sp. B-3 TaxID=2895565 RepID=UPI003FA53FD2